MMVVLAFILGCVAMMLFQKWWQSRNDKQSKNDGLRPPRTTGRA